MNPQDPIEDPLAERRARAETEKIEAEAAKTRAEARDLDRSPLMRPSAWLGVGSALIALIAGFTAIWSGYYDRQKQNAIAEQEHQKTITDLQTKLAQLEQARLKDDLDQANKQKSQLETQRNDLQDQIATLGKSKAEQEKQLLVVKSGLDDADAQLEKAAWERFQALTNTRFTYLRSGDLTQLANAVRALTPDDQTRAEAHLAGGYAPSGPTAKYLVSAVMLMATHRDVHKARLYGFLSYRPPPTAVQLYLNAPAWNLVTDSDSPLALDDRVKVASDVYGEIKSSRGFDAAGEEAVSFLRTLMAGEVLAKFRDPYIEHVRAIWPKPPQAYDAFVELGAYVDCGVIKGPLCLMRAARETATEVAFPSFAYAGVPWEGPGRVVTNGNGRQLVNGRDLTLWARVHQQDFDVITSNDFASLKTMRDQDFLSVVRTGRIATSAP